MTEARLRMREHSIGRVRMMKFELSPGATVREIMEVFGRVVSDCIQGGLRATLVVTQDRPAITAAELKSAVSVLDLGECPSNFRLAVVAFREPAYQAYLYALGPAAKGGPRRAVCGEIDAMEGLRAPFPD